LANLPFEAMGTGMPLLNFLEKVSKNNADLSFLKKLAKMNFLKKSSQKPINILIY
jgi:hypothetical protein